MGGSPSKATETEDHAPNTPNCSKPIIFVLGGPGTGKGTQCGRLTKEFGFKHLSVGDLLRDEVKKGTRIGKQCAELMKEGKLVPVKISLGLLKNAMKESNSQKGFLIDGFPRACNQARAFEKQIPAYQTTGKLLMKLVRDGTAEEANVGDLFACADGRVTKTASESRTD